MNRTSRKFEAVAIMTISQDGRRQSKVIIPTIAHDQAMAIAGALQGIDQLTAIPCKRDFDVFGRVFWTNRVED